MATKKLPEELGIVPASARETARARFDNAASSGGAQPRPPIGTSKVAVQTPPPAPVAPAVDASAMTSRGRGGKGLDATATKPDSGSTITERAAAANKGDTNVVPKMLAGMDNPAERGTKTVRRTVTPRSKSTVVTTSPTKSYGYPAPTRPETPVKNWRGANSEPVKRITKQSVDAQVGHQRDLYAKNHPKKSGGSGIHDTKGLKWFR